MTLRLPLFLSALLFATTVLAQATPPRPAEPQEPPQAPMANGLPVDPADLPPEEASPDQMPSDVVLPQIETPLGEANSPAPLATPRQRKPPAPMSPARRAELVKLTRVMGGLHALRVLCKGPDDQLWRERMSTMLDLETKGQTDQREGFVAVFNQAYNGEQARRVSCPSNAGALEGTLAKEGRRLALVLARWDAKSVPLAARDGTVPPRSKP